MSRNCKECGSTNIVTNELLTLPDVHLTAKHLYCLDCQTGQFNEKSIMMLEHALSLIKKLEIHHVQTND